MRCSAPNLQGIARVLLIGLLQFTISRALYGKQILWEQLPPKDRLGWQRLLHFSAESGSEATSNIQGRGFFVGGAMPPTAESEWNHLSAVVAQNSLIVQESAPKIVPEPWSFDQRQYACLFPARWRYYFKVVAEPYQKVTCHDLDQWRTRLAITSLSFVFANAYINNPASMFGHSFLRLNLSGDLPHHKGNMLDYGLGFLAASDPSDWLLYVYKGISGGYQGTYVLQPYYELLNQYAYGESRDLWEIEIPLTSFERLLVIDHLWEMLQFGQTPYYFTHVNCSSMLLEFIDAIKPDWALRRQISGFVLPPRAYQIVCEETKRLGKNLSQEFYWPSSRRLFEHSFAELSLIEQRKMALLAEKMVQSPNGVSDILQGSRVALMDTALAWVTLQKAEVSMSEQDTIRSSERHLMRARANVDVAQNDQPHHGQFLDFKAPTSSSPSQSHPPSLVSGGLGQSQNQNFAALNARYGYHDLIDPRPGFDPYTEVNYFNIGLKSPLNTQKKPKIAWDLRPAEVWSLVPYTTIEAIPSWMFLVGAKKDEDVDDPVIYGRAGLGWSEEFKSQQILVGFLPYLNLEVRPQKTFKGEISLRPMVYWKQHFTDDFAMLVRGTLVPMKSSLDQDNYPTYIEVFATIRGQIAPQKFIEFNLIQGHTHSFSVLLGQRF